MNYFITGGAGYIGSVLVPALLRRGHAVTVLDRFPHGELSLAACCQFSNFTPVRGDVRDDALVRQLMAKAEVIVPLSALVGAPACEADPWTAGAVNRDAVVAIARNLGRGQRLAYANTNSGYGISGDEPCTEDVPLNPISVYGRTKCEAERVVLDAGGVSLRLATVFGVSPRMRLDLLVNDFVYRAMSDRALTLFEAHHRRSVVHVHDVADAFVSVTEGDNLYPSMAGQPFNVVGDNITKMGLCEEIAELVPGFTWSEAAVGHDPDQRDYAVSAARLEALGWRPQRSLENGVCELFRAYAMINVRRFINA